MTDPISDFLTRLRNASKARLDECAAPHSTLKEGLAAILKAEGYVLDDEVECPFHQGRFHIPTGNATCAPATDPLKTWKVEIVDGRICINPDQPEGGARGE